MCSGLQSKTRKPAIIHADLQSSAAKQDYLQLTQVPETQRQRNNMDVDSLTR
jgi:hypothetical protein